MNKPIGPSFPSELEAAGLLKLPFAWGTDGQFAFDVRMTQAQIDAVLALYAAHDPTKPGPVSSLAQAMDAVIASPSLIALKALVQEWRKTTT